ncbi:MAG: hypothetical protein AAGA32_20575 [Pseudomonadota bacterium]
MLLTFGTAIPEFPLASDRWSVLESVVGLAFVQADWGAALHVCVQQPVDENDCPFRAPNVSECQCQLVLAWTYCQFLKELTGRD